VLTQTGNLVAGEKVIRTETGVIYEVVAAVPLNSPTCMFTIRAIGDPDGNGGDGDIGNLQPGDKLSFASAPATIGTEATVVAQVVAASDAETPERYRNRVLNKVQKRPQGGAYADYVEWAFDVPGIVNVYPYAGEDPGGSGPGQVDVYCEADPDVSGDPDGVPSGPMLTAVLNAINLNAASGKATRRPVSAAPNALPISRVEFDVEVTGLQPDTPETRIKITEGLAEHMLTLEPFIVGISTLPRKDRVTQAAVSGIIDSIASAQGATVSKVALFESAVEITAYTLNHGQKAKFGIANYA
jgi:hypothetical protein